MSAGDDVENVKKNKNGEEVLVKNTHSRFLISI